MTRLMPSLPLVELGRVTVYDDGTFSKTDVYYLGWIHGLDHSRFVHGFQGKETVVRLERIKPTVTFDHAGLWVIRGAA